MLFAICLQDKFYSDCIACGDVTQLGELVDVVGGLAFKEKN